MGSFLAAQMMAYPFRKKTGRRSLALGGGVLMIYFLLGGAHGIHAAETAGKALPPAWDASSRAGAIAQGFQPPPDRGVPGRREGGGTRSGNGIAGIRPTVLIPESNIGLTTLAQPILFVYVPAEVGGLTAEYLVANLTGDDPGKTTVILPAAAGVVGLPLPASVPDLEPGDVYQWSISIVLDPQDRGRDIFMSGAIERVTPDTALQVQLADLSIEAIAPLYAESGLWFDALNILAILRSQEPTNAVWAQQWETLLRSVDLGAIAPQPLRNETLTPID